MPGRETNRPGDGGGHRPLKATLAALRTWWTRPPSSVIWLIQVLLSPLGLSGPAANPLGQVWPLPQGPQSGAGADNGPPYVLVAAHSAVTC